MPFKVNLKKLREIAGMTQEELAKRAKLSKSTISMYERGERFPDESTLELFADIFNVDMNTLMGKQEGSTYYLDPETAIIAQQIKNRPGLVRVARLGKSLSEEDLEQIAQLTEFLAKKQGGGVISDVDDNI